MKEKKKYGVPAVLNIFWPGIGQIVKGQVSKGILIMIAAFVFALMCLILIGIPLYIILYIWAIYDAYNKEVQ